MNDRPEIECPTCNGEGEVEHPHLVGRYPSIVDECPPDPLMIDCEDCGGTSYRLMTDDELADAAERQAEDAANGEPPVSLDEQHRAAWAQKQDLRR